MSKKTLLLIILVPCFISLIIIFRCEDVRPQYQAAAVNDTVAFATQKGCANGAVKLLPIDMDSSVIHWKGTEFSGRGKHEGDIGLANGMVELCGSKLTGGWFSIDMNSIYITDIPLDDPIPRKNLRNHLMSKDFFAVEKFPLATFQITKIESFSADSARISGDLTMRDITHNITFDAAVLVDSKKLRASAQFSIIRQLWQINFIGSKLTSDLVDDEIYLDVRLSAHR